MIITEKVNKFRLKWDKLIEAHYNSLFVMNPDYNHYTRHCTRQQMKFLWYKKIHSKRYNLEWVEADIKNRTICNNLRIVYRGMA